MQTVTRVTYFKPRKSFSLSSFNVKNPFFNSDTTAPSRSLHGNSRIPWGWKGSRLVAEAKTPRAAVWQDGRAKARRPFRGEIRAILAAAARLKFVLSVKGCVPAATFDALQDEHAWLSAPWTGHSAESGNRSRCRVSACVGAVLFSVFF